MPLRMVEIVLDADAASLFTEHFDDVPIKSLWRVVLENGQHLIRIVVETDYAEKLMDLCSQRYGSLPEFRCFILEVHASLPHSDETLDGDDQSDNPEETTLKGKRISREELYADIEGPSQTNINYLALIALSTVVAAVGLVRNNVAVIIGAMVIAPLLGPNMALSLATLLVDSKLAYRAVKSIIIGVAEALLLAFLLGIALEVDKNLAELASRTHVGIWDVALALCAGAAGALSFTSGLSSALVGVMVAVALLPPLTTCGLLLALQDWPSALGAGLLFLTNMVCINLSGVIVFRLQGIKPGEKRKFRYASISTMASIAFWTTLLALLIWLITRRGGFAI